MKLSSTPLFLALFVFLFSLGSTSYAQSSGPSGYCSGSVYFGTPQEYGGVCINRGVCGTGTGGVNVTFVIQPSNPGILMMIFSLSDLKAKQSDQVAYFTDNSGSYKFDADFDLSGNSLFSPLNLPANSKILTTSPSTVLINGDIVIDFIQYSTPTN